MLSLTRKTDYALIALSHLATSGDRIVSAREVASRYNVPLPLLMNLLKLCAARGLVESVRGARGGYRLGKPADRITLVELVEAIEGPLRLGQCNGLVSKSQKEGAETVCQVGACCPVRVAVHNVHMRLQGFLAEMTIADVAQMAADATTRVLTPQASLPVTSLTEEYSDEAADLPGQ